MNPETSEIVKEGSLERNKLEASLWYPVWTILMVNRRKNQYCLCTYREKIDRYAKIQNLIKLPSLNGEIARILTFLHEQNRWGVELIDPKNENEQITSLAVKGENLYPIPNPNQNGM